MASVNKVILLGNLGQDPEIRYAGESNLAIATFSLATSRRYRNRDGQTVSETEWHRVVLFNRLAEIAKDYLHKGSPVYIEGRLRTRKWTDQNGNDRYTTEIVGEVMQLLSSRASDRHDGGDGFESAPRPAPARAPQPTRAAQPSAASASIDQLDEDVPI